MTTDPMSGSFPLVLASASPRRKELLALLGLPFEVHPSQVEEILPEFSPNPSELAVELATAKALEVSEQRPNALVLGADTLVVQGGRVYGKPSDAGDACRILSELSGRTHQVITGFSLTFHDGGQRWLHSLAVTSDVRFRSLAAAEIEAYVASGEPMDKAGAYAVQGCGSILIESVIGDFTNVIGLPIGPLTMVLRTLGVRVLGLP